MPCRYQPASLSNMSEDRVVSDLVRTCHQIHELTHRLGLTTQPQVFAFVRNRIRPYWNASVPTPVRRRLLNKCMDALADAIREGHSISMIADNVPLYLLNVMLDADIRELKVQLCCYYGCSHQNALLKLLATEAKGLVSLELVRPTLLRLGTYVPGVELNEPPATRHGIFGEVLDRGQQNANQGPGADKFNVFVSPPPPFPVTTTKIRISSSRTIFE